MTTTIGRRPLLTAMAIGLAATVALGGTAVGQDMLDLTLAVADGGDINPTTDSVLKLAAQLGFYEKHGLNLTIIALDGTPAAVAALNAGDADIADVSIDAALRLKAENDLPIRGIVAGTMGAPYLIAAKDSIATLADLVGKSYAIADNGSLDHSLTQVVLDRLGVAADGPQYVAIGAPASRVQALAAGQVDATTVSYGTFLPIKDTAGIHILVTPEEFAAEAPGRSKFIATLDSTIETKRDALQRFTDALIDASRSLAMDHAAWVAAMHEVRDDLSVENLNATAEFLNNRWCVNGCMNVAELGKTADFVYASDDFADVKTVAITDVIDTSFVTKSIETLGAYGAETIDLP
jgi:NitT/TauT family transport system substrate-binding protein